MLTIFGHEKRRARPEGSAHALVLGAPSACTAVGFWGDGPLISLVPCPSVNGLTPAAGVGVGGRPH